MCESYKDLVICFSRYHHDQSITMSNLYYDELIRKIEEYEGEKYLMGNDYTLDKVLHKILKIGIKKIEDTKILINAEAKLSDDFNLQNAMMLRTCY